MWTEACCSQFLWISLLHSNPSCCFSWWRSLPSKPVSPPPIPKASWLGNFLLYFSTARTSSLLSRQLLPLFSSTSDLFGFSWLCHQIVVFVLWYVPLCTVFAGKPHVAEICMQQMWNMPRKHLEESRFGWLKSVCRGRSLPAVGWTRGARQEAGCVPARSCCISEVRSWESVLFIK